VALEDSRAALAPVDLEGAVVEIERAPVGAPAEGSACRLRVAVTERSSTELGSRCLFADDGLVRASVCASRDRYRRPWITVY